MPLDFLKKIRAGLKSEGSFIGNASWVGSAKGLSILFSLLLTPIITRIYSPSDYGLFSVFMTLVNNYLIVSTLGFNDALVIEHRRKYVKNLLLISFSFVIVTSLIYLILLPYLTENYFEIPKNAFYFNYLIILLCFFRGTLSILQSLNVFFNKFKRGSLIGISGLTFNRTLVLILGINKIGAGLILSECFAKILSFSLHLRHYWRFVLSSFSVNIKEVLNTIKEYRNYPLLVLPSKYLRGLQSQLIIFFVAPLFGLASLGQIGLALSLINLPINLIGNAFESVFLRRVRDSNEEEMAILSRRLYFNIIIILIPFALTTSVLGGWIIPIILSAEWTQASWIICILIFTVYHTILELVFGGIFRLKRKEKLQFKYDLTSFSLISLGLLCAYLSNMELKPFILVYSCLTIIGGSIKMNSIFTLINKKLRIINIVVTILLLVSALIRFTI